MRSENTLLWSTWPATGARSKGVIRGFLFCFVLHLPLNWSIPSRGDIFKPPVDREQPITIDGDRASRHKDDLLTALAQAVDILGQSLKPFAMARAARPIDQ